MLTSDVLVIVIGGALAMGRAGWVTVGVAACLAVTMTMIIALFAGAAKLDRGPRA